MVILSASLFMEAHVRMWRQAWTKSVKGIGIWGRRIEKLFRSFHHEFTSEVNLAG